MRQNKHIRTIIHGPTAASAKVRSDGAFSPDGARLYCTVPLTSAIRILDTTTNTNTGFIDAGTFGGDIAVSPDGQRGNTSIGASRLRVGPVYGLHTIELCMKDV